MRWTELFVSWSPLGTYFTTVHRQGVRLWGTSSFETQEKFAHPFVMLFDFSPCEQYLVTWSRDPISVPEGASQGFIILPSALPADLSIDLRFLTRASLFFP
jgi:translation initiation factor 3 subunit B